MHNSLTRFNLTYLASFLSVLYTASAVTSDLRWRTSQASSSGCGVAPESRLPKARIVGGAEADPGDWPWLLRLGYSGQNRTEFVCGATLVGRRSKTEEEKAGNVTTMAAVTAAHCVPTPHAIDDLVLVAPARQLSVRKVIPHPWYTWGSKFDDIAVILLGDIPQEMMPVCLPEKGDELENVAELHVAGWGAATEDGEHSDTLQQITLHVHDHEDCFNAYKKLPNFVQAFQPRSADFGPLFRSVRSLDGREMFPSVSSRYSGETDLLSLARLPTLAETSQLVESFLEERERRRASVMRDGFRRILCASAPGKDACTGDSGGPLTHKSRAGLWQLHGVVSSGFGCGEATFPGIYTKVAEYRPWIDFVMQYEHDNAGVPDPDRL